MSRSTCNVKSRITRSSEALESDDSHIVEERLQKLLTNVKEHQPPRNIFNNVQEVPKLRRSVVARAVQNVVCSTPMPTEKKRDFFYTDNSLNISPIDPICEEVGINEDKDVQNNEQNGYKECNKEVKVILTRTSLPIVISDSEDEKEEQNVLKERQNQDIKESVDCKIHYNTGSELKINIENLQSQNNEITKNIPNTTQMSLRNRSNSKRNSSRNTLSIKKNKPLQRIKCTNKKDSKQTEVDSLKNESINPNASEKHSNFEQTQYKSPKSNNLINQNVDSDPNASTVPQAENISFQTSLHNVSRFLRSSNCITDPQNNCEKLQSVISSPDKTDTPQDNTNLKKNETANEVSDRCVKSIITTRSQNLSAANRTGRDDSKVLVEQVIGSSVNNNIDKQEKHVTYRSQSSRKSNCGNKTTEKVISCEDIFKNEVTRNECNTQHQKKFSSRKLYFTSKDEDKDIKNTSAMIPRNEIIPETAKEITKLSRIPVSRSRSKSKDKNLDSNTKKKNISLLETGEEKYSKDNCIHYKSPPKRPPRNKAKKKRVPMIENIPKINKDSFHNLQNKSGEGRDIDKFDEPLRQSDSDGTKHTTNKELPTVIMTKKLDQSNLSQVEGKEENTELRNDSNLNNVHNKEDEIIEKYINPEKTVEIGTSPVNFTPDKNDDATTHAREMVEAGTSTSKFDSDRNIFPGIDSEKAEKLTQLILKLTQRHQNSSFHVDNSVSQTESQKNNPHLLEKDKDLSELLPNSKDKQVRVTMTNKEVQTSIKRMSPPRNKKKSSKTGLGKESVRLDREDLSKSSTLTDHSDIIKECDESRNPYALFHSLENYNTNFSSSDDEFSEASFGNILENGPWRIDENLDIFPRRSSYKLNFLRSAQDIEMERLSQGLRNQSDSQLETTETGYKKPRVSSRTNNAVYAKRNKVQIYSRATNENNFQTRGLQAADVDNPSSSPRSVMSDLVITESYSDHDNQSSKQNGKGLLLTNENCQSVGNSKNKNSDETNADMALVPSNTKDVPEHDNLGDENPELPLKSSFSVAKGGTNTLKPNEEDTSSIYNIRTKTNDRDIKKQNSKSNRGNSIIENAVDSDDEILAVPLEDTNPPATEQTSVRTKESSLKTLNEVDKIVNSKAELHSNTEELEHVIKSPPSTLPVRKQRTSLNKNSVVHKSVKARAQKSRSRKIIPENDDGVSTTVDSEDVTGLRRSGRERKPVQRRFYGLFTTKSERVVEYYKGLCGEIIQSSIPAVSSKPRTKKNDKKANNDASNKQSGKKRGKRERNKKVNNIKPQNSKVKANKNISEVLDQNSRQTDDLNSNRVESQGAVIDEVASTAANSTSDIMIRKTSKRHPEQNYDSSPNITQHITNKKSKTPASKEDVHVENVKKCRVSPRKSKSNNSNSSEIIDFNTNIDADNITNNNNTINDVVDNYIRASQLHGEQNRDFAHQSLTHDNLNSVEEFTSVNKAIEKDSGRSTMLKSITFDESNVRNTKPLTGRISKNYKRKDKVCTKISKVLSRSINTSREHEIANENGSNVDSYLAANNDMDARSRRASIIQSRAVDSQYINLLINDNLVSMKYVEKDVKFKIIQDNLMVSEGLKNVKNGGTMGYLKLLPACQKSLHIARKFALFYAVIEGEGIIHVHNKTSIIGKLSTFTIPVGVEYSIVNTSKEDALVLLFVKMPDSCH